MFNLEGDPLPDDGVPVIYFTGGEKETWNDYHDFVDEGGKRVRLVLRNFHDWQQTEVMQYAAQNLQIVKKGDALPYDTVMVSSTTWGDVPITFARNSETDESFIHCSLSGDFDVVLHMKFDPDFLPSNDDTKREDHQEHTPGKVLGE